MQEARWQAHPKSFALLKIWTKSRKIWVKPQKIWVRCLKIRAKWRPTFAEKHNQDLFLEVTPKSGLHARCGRKFVGKKAFRASLGKFGQKSCAPPKLCPLLHLWPWQQIWIFFVINKKAGVRSHEKVWVLGSNLSRFNLVSRTGLHHVSGKEWSSFARLWTPNRIVYTERLPFKRQQNYKETML